MDLFKSEENKKYNNVKAIKRALVFHAIVCLLTVILISAVATAAWLSMNTTVSSNGVTMGIEKTPNLIISSTNDGNPGSISALTDESWGDDYILVNWSSEATVLLPSKHNSDSDTGLVYITNPEDISRTTGMIEEDNEATLHYSNVPTYTGGARYYIDYMVYVASLGKNMIKNEEFSDLTLDITEASSLASIKDAYKATSVDIYAMPVVENETRVSVNDDNYKGTLNLTGNSNSVSISDISTIPLNTDGSVAILLRCYFDGEIGPNEGQAYVNSNAVALATENVAFNIAIQAN